MRKTMGYGGEWSAKRQIGFLSLSHSPFLGIYSATLPSHSHSHRINGFTSKLLQSQQAPQRRVCPSLSHPLSFFILYMPSSHFFLLLLIWVFQIRDQFDWIVHARSLCPFNHSLCKSHILFLIHIYCYVLSIFSYCSDFSHRFSLFFATHFPPIAFSVIPTLCSLAL